MKRQAIGDLLLQAHLVDETQLELALAAQRRTGQKLGSALVELRLVDENVLAAFLSRQIDIPCVSLLNVEIPVAVLRRVPAGLAHQLGAVPVRMDGNALECAMIDPTDIDQITTLEHATGLRIDPLVAPESSIRRVLSKYYPLGDEGIPSEPGATPGGESILFPELATEVEQGNTRISERLEALEGEVRSLRGRIEELLAELRAARS